MAFINDDQRLHSLCHDGNLKRVKELLDDMKRQGIDVPAKLSQKLGVFGYTPLHEAVTDGHPKVLQLLIDYGGFVNSKASSGYTPLHLAASGGHVECARILLLSGADLSSKDEYQKTPLDTAELSARTNVVKVLRSAAIIKAIESNSAQLNDLLSVSKSQLEPDCLTRALQVATEKGNAINAGKVIIKGRDSIDIPSALEYAMKKHAHSVRGLLLLVVAASMNDLSLLAVLYGKNVPNYYNDLIDDPEFHLVQEAIQNREVATAVPIEIARWKKSPEIREELLMLTDVNEEEGTVLWHGLRLTELELNWLRRVKWAKKFMLAKNDFASLPSQMGNYLSNVVKLNLQYNSLKEFPRCLLELPSIEDLNLSYNKLQDIPEVHEWSNSLTVVDLSHNELSTLPLYCEAPNLKKLSLSHNKFRQVPMCVCSFTNLQFLELGDNPDILNLPMEMGRLQNLVELHLDNLKDLNDPPKPIRSNARHCITYLNQKLRSIRGYYRMKLMLVGKQERGKTTLVARLQGKNVKESDNQSTVGIDVSEWRYSPRAIGKPFTFNIWDFGGQEEYYATHQCFLTERSLYLLVWNITHGEEGVKELKPWLDNIALRAPHSRVIIVATHYDKVSEEDREQSGKASLLLAKVVKMAENYQKLKVYKVTVVGLHGKLDNLEHLKKLIYDAADDYTIGGEKVMGRSIPSSYHELDNALAMLQRDVANNKRSPVMHAPEFKALIRELNLTDISSDEEVKTATLFLHEVGSLLHYDDRKNNLDDLYFVDPRWLCDMMSTVVTIEQRNPYVKNGIIHRSSLPLLYRGKQFPTEFLEQYLVLLDRFEVALPLDQDKNLILIPSMLPDVRPDDIDKPDEHVCYERYIQFDVPTPPGFWSRLLARTIHSLKSIQDLVARNSTNTVEVSTARISANVDSSTLPLADSADNPSVEVSSEKNPTSKTSSIDSVPSDLKQQISKPLFATMVNHSMIQVDDITLKYWKSGICYQSPQLYFCVEDLCNIGKDSKNGVSLTVSKTEEGCKVYGQLIDLIGSLVVDWYNGLLENRSSDQDLRHVIKCHLCSRAGVPNPHQFERSSLVQYIVENSPTLYCPGEHEVDIVDIVPDLVLADLDRQFFLTEDDVRFTKSEKDHLGTGGFGSVYRGYCRQQSVAVKIFNANVKGDPLDALHELRVEAKVLQQNHHPCLVSMVGVTVFPKPSLVMEEAPMGSLSGPLLKDKIPISRVVLFRIAAQIASALKFLHGLSYIYRDLKASNVLLWSLGLDHLINCKLADFGIVASSAPIGVRGAKGTSGFIAPEVAYVGANHNRNTYDSQADTFSYAMILYQIVTRHNPFFDVKQIQISTHIEQGRRPRLDYPVSTVGLYTMTQMMKRCWKQIPSNRPSMDTIIKNMSSPEVQLVMGVREVKSQRSLRTACCCTTRSSSSTQGLTLSPTPTLENPSNELWICCDNEKGADVGVYEMNNMAVVKTHPIPEKQVQCMSVCSDHVWIASRRGLECGTIDICSIKTRNVIHSIRMKDTSVSCITSSNTHVYIGTMEGYVFMYKVGIDAIRSKEKPYRRYLSEDCIDGLAVTGSSVWVSSTNQILFCNLNTLEKMRSRSLPTDVPGYVGQLSVNESKSLVWSAHLGGRMMCAWDIQHQSVKFSIGVRKVLSQIAPESTPNVQVITAMCCALDTIWCGMGTGHIVIFSSHGDMLLHFHPYRDYVRFLVPVTSAGPCSSEECMILSGGKKYARNVYLEDVSDDPMQPDVSEDKVKDPRSVKPNVKEAGTVVLWEALRSCYLRQMKVLSSGDTWQSYDLVKDHKRRWEESEKVFLSTGDCANLVRETKLKEQEDLQPKRRLRTQTFAMESIAVRLPSGDVEQVKCPKPVLLKKLLAVIRSEGIVGEENTVLSLSYLGADNSIVNIVNQNDMDQFIAIKNRPTLDLQVTEQ